MQYHAAGSGGDGSTSMSPEEILQRSTVAEISERINIPANAATMSMYGTFTLYLDENYMMYNLEFHC